VQKRVEKEEYDMGHDTTFDFRDFPIKKKMLEQ